MVNCVRFQRLLATISFGWWVLPLPVAAQGAFVTTVSSFSASQSGHNVTQLRQQDTEQQVYNGFSLSTDSQKGSSSNTTVVNGATRTETYNYGTTTSSQSIEQGVYNNTTTVDYFESYDYADFNDVHSITTGANGERGPQRAADQNLRR